MWWNIGFYIQTRVLYFPCEAIGSNPQSHIWYTILKTLLDSKFFCYFTWFWPSLFYLCITLALIWEELLVIYLFLLLFLIWYYVLIVKWLNLMAFTWTGILFYQQLIWRSGTKTQSLSIMSRIWFCGQRNYGHVLKLCILYCLKTTVRYARFVFKFFLIIIYFQCL